MEVSIRAETKRNKLCVDGDGSNAAFLVLCTVRWRSPMNGANNAKPLVK